MDDDEYAELLGLDLTGRQPSVKSNAGHNKQTELDKYAEDARRGLAMVQQGEDDVIAGWIIYGEALKKGREEFPSDEQFGEWKHREGLCDSRCRECKRVGQLDTHQPYYKDALSSMWAAEDPDRMYKVLEENPKIRTVRGAHAKWKKDNPTPKTPKGGSSTDPNLRLPTEEEAKRIRNMKDRIASTDSEPEKEAVQKKLEKLKESGIDVDSVVSQEEEDNEREAYRNKQRPLDYMANEIARILIDTKDYSFVAALAKAAYPKDGELEQAYEIITEGQ